MSDQLSPLTILLLASAVSLFCALSRQALDDFSFSDAEELLRKAGRSKQEQPRIERYADRIADHALTFRFLDYIARAIAAVALWVWVAQAGWQMGPQVAWFALGFLIHLSVHELLVRPLGSAFPESLTLRLQGTWSVLHGVFWLPTLPLRLGHQGIERLLRGGEKEAAEEQADDEILAAVSQSEYAGQINEEERDMIESVLELGNITVDKVMTPRTDMHAVPLEDGTAGVIAVAEESGHSRLPVYETNRDNIIGICYVKDLIGRSREELPDLRGILRTPVLVPASKQVPELLTELRRNRVHMAIVLDEYGGTAGLITIEDIIEEVFGEIEDEYDEIEDEDVRNVDESTRDLDAKLHVDEVNERFNVNLPESDRYESLGGLLTAELGCIPAGGQVWENDNVRLTVLEATDRRVVRIRLEEIGVESKVG